MSNPKINVIGIVYQNNHGERYFSKYFIKHCTTNLAKCNYRL